MKLIFLTLSIIVFISLNACSVSEDPYADNQFMGEMGVSGNIVMHPVMDTKRGMLQSKMPLPADWEIVIPKTLMDPNIIGPGGIKAYFRSGGMYAFSQDPFLQQSYQQMGRTMRAAISVDQIVEQDLVPKLHAQGLKMVKHYPLPQIAQRYREENSKLFKASIPSQEIYDALGTEWVDNKGKRMLIIVDEYISIIQGDTLWGYLLKMIEHRKNNSMQRSMLLSTVL
ncbi:MAG: hypothetical protein V3W04_10255 [Gammaproteobacteria bacterium]